MRGQKGCSARQTGGIDRSKPKNRRGWTYPDRRRVLWIFCLNSVKAVLFSSQFLTTRRSLSVCEVKTTDHRQLIISNRSLVLAGQLL